MAEEKPPLITSPSTTFPVFSIWPPNQKTRDAVIQRLVETLSTPSVLSKRYGVMDAEEAASTARIIENQAFVTTSESPPTASDDPSGIGIETLQIYSKEISKLILDAVKAKASSTEKPATVPVEAVAVPMATPTEDLSQSIPCTSGDTSRLTANLSDPLLCFFAVVVHTGLEILQ